MEPPETIEVDTNQVSCDGGAAGHPKVYLTIGDAGFVGCPYCDCRFTLKAGVKTQGAH